MSHAKQIIPAAYTDNVEKHRACPAIGSRILSYFSIAISNCCRSWTQLEAIRKDARDFSASWFGHCQVRITSRASGNETVSCAEGMTSNNHAAAHMPHMYGEVYVGKYVSLCKHVLRRDDKGKQKLETHRKSEASSCVALLNARSSFISKVAIFDCLTRAILPLQLKSICMQFCLFSRNQ